MQEPYYEKPRFSLYQANCLDVLGELPENSVDMIFADPPYFLSDEGLKKKTLIFIYEIIF
jgi:site-specific DNA-methyltransferase (adenine-specific)